MDDFLFASALSRTPDTCPTDFCDDLTRVGISSIAGAGHGLFAVSDLESRFPLYAFTGVPVSDEEADRYPNAYQLTLDGHKRTPPGETLVLDASGSLCSPAKYPNSRGVYILSGGNNCQFEQHNDVIYLVTDKRIKAGEELFTAYGEQKPMWPMTFLGCAKSSKLDFMQYLSEPPVQAKKDNLREGLSLLADVANDLLQEQTTQNEADLEAREQDHRQLQADRDVQIGQEQTRLQVALSVCEELNDTLSEQAQQLRTDKADLEAENAQLRSIEKVLTVSQRAFEASDFEKGSLSQVADFHMRLLSKSYVKIADDLRIKDLQALNRSLLEENTRLKNSLQQPSCKKSRLI